MGGTRMETELLNGTRAGELLKAELPGLLEKWNGRHDNSDAADWVGFGVTLAPSDPKIVIFKKDGIVDEQHFYNFLVPGSSHKIVQASFQTIPGRDRSAV